MQDTDAVEIQEDTLDASLENINFLCLQRRHEDPLFPLQEAPFFRRTFRPNARPSSLNTGQEGSKSNHLPFLSHCRQVLQQAVVPLPYRVLVANFVSYFWVGRGESGSRGREGPLLGRCGV